MFNWQGSSSERIAPEDINCPMAGAGAVSTVGSTSTENLAGRHRSHRISRRQQCGPNALLGDGFASRGPKGEIHPKKMRFGMCAKGE